MADSNSSVAIISKIFSITGTPDVNASLCRKIAGWVIENCPGFMNFSHMLKKVWRKKKDWGSK